MNNSFLMAIKVCFGLIVYFYNIYFQLYDSSVQIKFIIAYIVPLILVFAHICYCKSVLNFINSIRFYITGFTRKIVFDNFTSTVRVFSLFDFSNLTFNLDVFDTRPPFSRAVLQHLQICRRLVLLVLHAHTTRKNNEKTVFENVTYVFAVSVRRPQTNRRLADAHESFTYRNYEKFQ